MTGPGKTPPEERQTVTVSAGELENPHGESRQKAVEPEGPGKNESRQSRPESAEAEAEEQIKYFTKTAELMGKEATDPVRIRESLFREVREWETDGPTTADLPAQALEIAMDTVLERDAPPAAVEPSIIAIEGKSPIERREPAERTEKEGIEEQSFNLSIGTISVIIEGGDGPPPVNHTNQNPGRETRPQSSRLRRNYI